MTVLTKLLLCIVFHLCLETSANLYVGKTFSLVLDFSERYRSFNIVVMPVEHLPVTVEIREHDKDTKLLKSEIVSDIKKMSLAEIQNLDSNTQFKALFIRTSCDVIVLASIESITARVTRFTLLPMTSWGTDYYISLPSNNTTTALSVTTVTRTDTEFELWTMRDDLLKFNFSCIPVGARMQSFTNESMQIVMELYETLFLKTSDSFSNIHVVSNSTVLIGTEVGKMCLQQLPRDLWGTRFLTINVNGDYSTYFRITNANVTTTVNINHPNGTASIQWILSPFSYRDITVLPHSVLSVVSTEAIDVKQISPNFELVPHLNMFSNCYIINEIEFNLNTSFVYIVISQAARTTLKLNNLEISNSNVRELTTITVTNTLYSILKLSLGEGTHYLSSLEARFLITLENGFHLPGTISDNCGKFKVIVNDIYPNKPLTLDTSTGDNTPDGPLNSSVLAIIISLSAAVFLVIACIIGFIIIETCCRRGNEHRNAKVTPFVAT